MTPLSGIITGGLGLPACSSMIIAKFHLGPCGIVIKKVLPLGGGSKPLRPGQIKNMYKPVDTQYTPLIPVKLNTPKEYLSIKINFNGKETHKEFLLPQQHIKAKTIVKLTNLVSRADKTFQYIITNLKLIRTNTKATIKNFIKKDVD